MSIQLKIDEMLDFLEWADHSEAKAFIRRVEHLADDLADAIAKAIPELTRNGPALFEGTAFAGTCAPFEPTSPGPVPTVLDYFNVEVQEWMDMQP